MLTPHVEAALAKHDWRAAISLCSSTEMLGLTLMVLDRFPTQEERAEVLADSIRCSDLLMRNRRALIGALRSLRKTGNRLIDGPRAADEYGKLPATFTVYRGTCAAEGTKYGVSWTLNLKKALWFATGLHRTRNHKSTPVLLSASVEKTAVCGVLFEREEFEVLVLPRDLKNIVSAPVAGTSRSPTNA